MLFRSREELLAVLNGLHAKGITLLLATHDIDFAYRWADDVHLMARGRCTASFASTALPAREDDLKAAGLPSPQVIALHRALVARGLLAATPLPRSQRELVALLETGALS